MLKWLLWHVCRYRDWRNRRGGSSSSGNGGNRKGGGKHGNGVDITGYEGDGESSGGSASSDGEWIDLFRFFPMDVVRVFDSLYPYVHLCQ